MKKHILYLGANGFPIGMAQIQRQLHLAKALLEAGYKVTVCSRRGVINKELKNRENIKYSGTFEKINYIFTSFSCVRPSNFFMRNVLKIIGIIGEFIFILWKTSTQNVHYFVINTVNLFDLKYYALLAKILNVKVVYDYVEYIGSLKISKGKNKQFDTHFIEYCDFIIYISEFLKDTIKKQNKDIPILKIPPLTDFSIFDTLQESHPFDKPYFLFCGSADYYTVIEFIINAFGCLEKDDFYLILVVNGSTVALNKIDLFIKNQNKKSILRDSNIPYSKLITYYKNASALLIPFRENNLQDKARFPHKISEYTASGNPVILTPAKEMEFYFQDGKNALIAENYDAKSFAKKMQFIIDNPLEAIQIGVRGRQTGEMYFDYKMYSGQLYKFLNE